MWATEAKAEVPWHLNTDNSFGGVQGIQNIASPRGTSIGIGVESPSGKTRTRSETPSARASEKPLSEQHSAAFSVSDPRPLKLLD